MYLVNLWVGVAFVDFGETVEGRNSGVLSDQSSCVSVGMEYCWLSFLVCLSTCFIR
jgi:hypothetical protein